jgi:hypothetical protein
MTPERSLLLPLPILKEGEQFTMKTRELKTIHSEPGQAWEMVWNELGHAGITKGHAGPVDGDIRWGENAAVAIERLQESKLPASDVNNIGLLLQAALHGAEIFWSPAGLAVGSPKSELVRP